MTRPAAAVVVALCAPVASCAVAVALHTGAAFAPTFAALLVAAPIISRPYSMPGGST